MLRLLALLDHEWAQPLLRVVNKLSFANHPVEIGGVTLPHPMILGAGLVKGEGFAHDDEASALAAVTRNIMPGWRSMPSLACAVEFGSFTRYPRKGNSGVVMWRNVKTHSTQNRFGLKNPGAQAAAEFLARRKERLPKVYGINLAVSPGVTDLAQERREVLEALASFLDRGVYPSWFTLNVSCPNTEDDPGSHQTETRTRDLCAAVIDLLAPHGIPLWVKISPDLADDQYTALLRAFAETGVRAVIASNTVAKPTPNDPNVVAGMGGGELHDLVLEKIALLSRYINEQGYLLDLIACGGVQDGKSYHDFAHLGIGAMQYMSAYLFFGPLAGGLIEEEANGKRTAANEKAARRLPQNAIS